MELSNLQDENQTSGSQADSQGSTVASNITEDLLSAKKPVMTYERTQILGRGAFGTVFEGTFNGIKVAVKRIQLLDLDEAVHRREENAMKELDHPNVLKLLHVEENDDFKFLVLEFCEATLRDYIKRYYLGPMPKEAEGLRQMASGLDYIHNRNFVHRNIKPENVLITSNATLRIADFGLCKPVSFSGSFSLTSGPRGTRIYYAPEYLRWEEKSKEEKEKIRANVSIDVFSLGCLFFSFIKQGDHPFAKPGSPITYAVAANIVNNKKYLHLGMAADHYAYEMIDGMTQYVPESRWPLDKVLKTIELHLKQSLNKK